MIEQKLLEVRKAYRIVYDYQARLRDIAASIADVIGKPDELNVWTSYPKSRDHSEIYSWDLIPYYYPSFYWADDSGNAHQWLVSFSPVADLSWLEADEPEDEEIVPSELPASEDSQTVAYLCFAVPNKSGAVDLVKAFEKIEGEDGKVKVTSGQAARYFSRMFALSHFTDPAATRRIVEDFVSEALRELDSNQSPF